MPGRAQDLRGHLRLEAEVVGDQVEAAHEVAPERLVADLHVGDRRVVEDVREQRQQAVAGVVPEEVRALRARRRAGGCRRRRRPRPSSSGPSSAGRSAGSYSRSASWMTTMSPAEAVDARPHGGALAAVDALLEQAQRLDLARRARATIADRPVGGAVVDDDDLRGEAHARRRGAGPRAIVRSSLKAGTTMLTEGSGMGRGTLPSASAQGGEIGLHHLVDHLLEAVLGLPAQPRRGRASGRRPAASRSGGRHERRSTRTWSCRIEADVGERGGRRARRPCARRPRRARSRRARRPAAPATRRARRRRACDQSRTASEVAEHELVLQAER